MNFARGIHAPRRTATRAALALGAAAVLTAALLALNVPDHWMLGAGEAPPPVTSCAVTDATCAPPGVGVPLALSDLTVTLRASSTEPRPIDLTVEVQDANGNPVDDAAVTIATNHLEMNHGLTVNEAIHQRAGRYLAEHVPMGMNGTWRADVTISRPNRAAVIATFDVQLSGGPG